MRMRAKDIQDQTFKVTFRGFDPVEVDGFLNRVADEMERLHEEKSNLELELDVERAGRRSLEEALDSAGRIHEAMAEKAREEARIIVERAKLDAERTALENRERMGELKRTIEELEQRRIVLLAELGALAGGLADWVRRQEEKAGGAPDVPAPEIFSGAYQEVPPYEPPPDIEPVYDPTIILHDQRSQMLMDLMENPESFTPGKARAKTSAELEEEIEPIEIIEEIEDDIEIPKK